MATIRANRNLEFKYSQTVYNNTEEIQIIFKGGCVLMKTRTALATSDISYEEYNVENARYSLDITPTTVTLSETRYVGTRPVTRIIERWQKGRIYPNVYFLSATVESIYVGATRYDSYAVEGMKTTALGNSPVGFKKVGASITSDYGVESFEINDYEIFEPVEEENYQLFTIHKLPNYSLKRANVKIHIETEIIRLGKDVYIEGLYNPETHKVSIPNYWLMSGGVIVEVELQEGDYLYDVEVDHKKVAVKDGFVISDELNETLDSGTIQFLSKGKLSDIERNDVVSFEGENIDRKKLLVDTFLQEIESFEDELEKSDFFVTANLYSETKLLERITVPQLTITKTGSEFTVWDKVKQYCIMYLPRVYVFDPLHDKQLVCAYRYDKTLEEKLNMVAPELSWNNATLREVLTDLFMVNDLIPVIKDNVLTYIDLNDKGNEIDTSKLTDLTVEGSSADYCDEITLPMQNVIQPTTTHAVEFISLKPDGSAELTTENACFITQKPIYKINNITIYAKVHYRATGVRRFEMINITDRVFEKEEFNTFSGNNRVSGDTWESRNRNQHYALYYTRGSNVIPFITASDKIILDETRAKISRVIEYIKKTTLGITGVIQVDDDDLREIFAEIDYEAIDESTIKVSRLTESKNSQNTIYDGQRSAMVDLNNQTKHEYSKINRLGGKKYTIKGEYTSESEVPQLADHIGNKVLYSRTLSFYDGQIFFEGKLTENYVLRNYFTGVASKHRSWQIINQKDASVRHDIFKAYVTASFNTSNIDTTYSPIQFKGELNHFADIFLPSSERTLVSFKHLFFKTGVEDIAGESPFGASEFYELDHNVNAIGRSLTVDFSTISNSIAGNSVSNAEDDYWCEPLSYVSENGEFDRLTFMLQSVYNYGAVDDYDFNSDLNDIIDNPTLDEEKFQRVTSTVRTTPRAYASGMDLNKGVRLDMIYYKDNKEQLKGTIQFEFVADNKEIIIKDEYAKTVAYLPYNTNPDLIIRSSSERTEEWETIGKGEQKSNWEITVEQTENNATTIVLNTNGETLEESGSWQVCDSQNRLLFAVNGDHNRFVLEVRLIKDNNVYNNVIDRVKIGRVNESYETVRENAENNPSYIDTIKVNGREIKVADTGVFDFLM